MFAYNLRTAATIAFKFLRQIHGIQGMVFSANSFGIGQKGKKIVFFASSGTV